MPSLAQRGEKMSVSAMVCFQSVCPSEDCKALSVTPAGAPGAVVDTAVVATNSVVPAAPRSGWVSKPSS